MKVATVRHSSPRVLGPLSGRAGQKQTGDHAHKIDSLAIFLAKVRAEPERHLGTKLSLKSSH